MKIQSISIVVPTNRCVNNCKFCVSKMHESKYVDQFDAIAYRKRIKYAAMNGVTSLILTGTGEALQNKRFLALITEVLRKENHPFPNVEIQTTGVFLNESWSYVHPDNGQTIIEYPNVKILKDLSVNTISLSVSDIFNNKNNMDIIGTPEKIQFDLDNLCKFIKNMGFNLRLSLNLTNAYDSRHPVDILSRCKGLGADQITFRELFSGNQMTREDIWVKGNRMNNIRFKMLSERIEFEGKQLYTLPFGANVYSINGMSVALDNDCMSTNKNESLKYVILRENGKLYCRWDDEGSLIF